MNKLQIANELYKNTKEFINKFSIDYPESFEEDAGRTLCLDLLQAYIKNQADIENRIYNESDIGDELINDFFEKSVYNLDFCLDYIKIVGFDVKGWALFDAQVTVCMDFTKAIQANQPVKCFSLQVDDVNDVIPYYLNEDNRCVNAKSIQEAIRNYNSRYIGSISPLLIK